MEQPEITEIAPGPVSMAGGGRRMLLGLGLIVACCLLLLYIAVVERNWLASEPWAHAIARIDAAPPPEGAVPARFRRLPKEALPPDTSLVAAMRDQLQVLDATSADQASSDGMLDLMGANLAEMLIMLPAEDADLAKVLESGRLPRRGMPEALRGDLARTDSFELDGVKFTVTGRLKPTMGGAAFAYVLPEDPGLAAAHFSADKGAQVGWYATNPDSVGESKAFSPDEQSTAAPQAEQPVAQTRTRTAYAVGSLFALIIGALGGYWLHLGLFARLQRHSALCRAALASPRLFAGMHIFLYGAFFFSMLRGAQLPLNNIAIAHFVYGQFTSGELQYIGDAYASGDILRAAVATFRNNYFLQTFVLTFVISLWPFALGIVKTLFSFTLTGFTMVPIWTGTAEGYSFHSVTMVLELEAYIVACFVVALWTVAFYRACYQALFGRLDVPALRTIGRVYLEGIAMTAVMLAVAGLYEAVTLILFSNV